MKHPVRLVCIGMVFIVSEFAMAQSKGADTYKAKCVMCHAIDGSGNTPAGKATKTPSFDSPEMSKMSDAEFIADTKNGKGKMPAYSGKLSDKEIADVVTYIRTLQKNNLDVGYPLYLGTAIVVLNLPAG